MKGLNLRDRYAAEARDEHVTELDKLLYIIIALVKVKTSKYLSKINEVWNETRGWKKKTQFVRFFWFVTFAIYGKNNSNTVVGEIP